MDYLHVVYDRRVYVRDTTEAEAHILCEPPPDCSHREPSRRMLDAGLPVHGAMGGDISKCPYYAAKMTASSGTAYAGQLTMAVLRHPTGQPVILLLGEGEGERERERFPVLPGTTLPVRTAQVFNMCEEGRRTAFQGTSTSGASRE
ncbi:unnamed protein product [Pleuronectes platessa]|uniref:Uncharacterized protein n=1 Tax=Pleuronectes platessa TaxID=8262 RepID=A0A9N7VRP0_PLEPL|nr:unnamed protein product [Pleuronectes platessa]